LPFIFSPRRNYFWCSKGFGWLTSEAEGYKPLKWKIKEGILQGRKKLICYLLGCSQEDITLIKNMENRQ